MCLASASVLLSALSVSAQATPEGPPLSLGSTEALRGSEATIPVLYFPEAEQSRLEAVKLRMCLSEEHVTFVRAEAGMAGEAGKAEVKSNRAAAGEAQACIPIEVQADFQAAPIDGTLLRLILKVDADAPVDQIVKIEGVFEPTRTSGGAAEPISSEGQLKIIEVMPVFSCFFYMH